MMSRPIFPARSLLLLTVLALAALVLSVSGCAGTSPMGQSPFRFTTEGLEATTDAAAALADGSTKATKELLGPLKRMMSNIAPGGSGEVSERVKVAVFAIVNHDRLRTDIARGGGEHLTAFANLIRLPPDRHPRLAERLQRQYPSIYAPADTPFQSVDRLLMEHYDLTWKAILLEHPS